MSHAGIQNLKERLFLFTDCRNSLAKDETVVSMLVLMLNIFCLFLLSVEIIYLVRNKRIRRNFTVDIEFYSYYFFKRASIRRVRIYTQKLTSVNTEVLIGHCENRLLLDDIFVDLALQINNGELIYRYDDLYLPTASRVLVDGAPGRGKALLCQKLLRDWSKTPLDNFVFAFLFKFSWFNSEETSNVSLKDLLNRGACSEGIVETVFRQLVDNPVKVLLIFDGLNEFKHLQSCTENNEAGYENSVTAKIPVSALYLKILQNNIIFQFPYFHRIARIQEFTDDKVYKWVDNYCKGAKDNAIIASAVEEYIGASSHLLSLCRIPVFCYIVCDFMRSVIVRDNSNGIRLTDVYQRALKFFVFMHHPDYKGKPFTPWQSYSGSVEETLSDLGLLAEKGLEEGRHIFHSEEIGIGTRNCCLLEVIAGENGKREFSFLHPAFQDFLASRKIVRMEPAALKTRVKRYLQSEKETWFLILQFLLGLLRGQPNEAVEGYVECLKESLLSTPTQVNGKMT